MAEINIPAVVIVSIIALGIVIFSIIRNKKDRKKELPPHSTEDQVDEIKRNSDRRKDAI